MTQGRSVHLRELPVMTLGSTASVTLRRLLPKRYNYRPVSKPRVEESIGAARVKVLENEIERAVGGCAVLLYDLLQLIDTAA